jgi:hypothetical protein
MRRLALLLALLPGIAWAQPNEVESEGLIQLSLGEAKAFEFRDDVSQIFFAPKDIVEATPQTDRMFTVSPLAPGTTRMFVRGRDSKLIYNVEIVVSPEPGHMVKMYGDKKNDDLNAGYTAVYCTETGCERPDRDLPKPTAVTVERISRFKDGAK